jgi:hypothetical protein
MHEGALLLAQYRDSGRAPFTMTWLPHGGPPEHHRLDRAGADSWRTLAIEIAPQPGTGGRIELSLAPGSRQSGAALAVTGIGVAAISTAERDRLRGLHRELIEAGAALDAVLCHRHSVALLVAQVERARRLGLPVRAEADLRRWQQIGVRWASLERRYDALHQLAGPLLLLDRSGEWSAHRELIARDAASLDGTLAATRTRLLAAMARAGARPPTLASRTSGPPFLGLDRATVSETIGARFDFSPSEGGLRDGIETGSPEIGSTAPSTLRQVSREEPASGSARSHGERGTATLSPGSPAAGVDAPGEHREESALARTVAERGAVASERLEVVLRPGAVEVWPVPAMSARAANGLRARLWRRFAEGASIVALPGGAAGSATPAGWHDPRYGSNRMSVAAAAALAARDEARRLWIFLSTTVPSRPGPRAPAPRASRQELFVQERRAASGRVLVLINRDPARRLTATVTVAGRYRRAVDLGIGSGARLRVAGDRQRTRFDITLEPGESTLVALNR